MTPELTVLALAALLQVVQFALMAIPANLELGVGKTASPRDTSRLKTPLVEQVSDRTGRLMRAFTNHFEALILFTIAVVVVSVSDQSTGFTRLGLPRRARPLHSGLCPRLGAVAVVHLFRRPLGDDAHDPRRAVLRRG